MHDSSTALQQALLTVAVQAGLVANVCDHAEHNEPVDLDDVRSAGLRLRECAIDLAHALGSDPIQLYRDRLRQIERRNVLYEPGGFDGAAAVHSQATWRALQLAQVEHDRVYHPDVIGLTKLDQLRHFALHIAKLAGSIASLIAGDVALDDFIHRRLPDLLLFGLKLSTVVGERLPEAAVIPEHELLNAARV